MTKRVDASIGRRMEKDVLRAVADYGLILPGTPAERAISAEYPNEGRDLGEVIDNKVTIVIDGMVADGLLFPVTSAGGPVTGGRARGLTPKGWERLYQLDHPVRLWMKQQWFPLTVAVVTSLVSAGYAIADIVITLVVKPTAAP